MAKIKFFKDVGLTKKVAKMLEFIQNIDYYNCDIEKEFSKKFNVKFLGSGINAYAFRLNSKKIIRIEFQPSKEGYFMWMKYCLKNQEMKSVPKIALACLINKDKSNECLVTVTELLIPLQGSKVFKNIEKTSALIWGFFDESASDGTSNVDIFSKIQKQIKPGFEKIIFPQEYAKIKKAVKTINDLHSGNMMLSPNKKRLVLTDPICD